MGEIGFALGSVFVGREGLLRRDGHTAAVAGGLTRALHYGKVPNRLRCWWCRSQSAPFVV